MLWFTDMILSYYPKDFGIVAVAPINTGMTCFLNAILLLLPSM
jgi:hypothetical protein